MMFPRWFTALATTAIVVIAGLLVLDWITDERLGAWAPYASGAALVLLMILAIGAASRTKAGRTTVRRNRSGRDHP